MKVFRGIKTLRLKSIRNKTQTSNIDYKVFATLILTKFNKICHFNKVKHIPK